MGHRLLSVGSAIAVLVCSSASAQVLGVAPSPRTTFQPAAESSKPDPSPPRPEPPGQHHRGAAPQPGNDLFLAGPDTYAPRDSGRSRFRPHVPVSPYSLIPVPYFLPGDSPIARVARTGYSAQVDHSAVEAGYLVLRMEPRTAQVFIDDFFVGSADDAGSSPYLLEPGPHRIELRAPGFEAVAFDVRIRPNETITYTRRLEGLASPAPTAKPVVATPPAATPKVLYVIPRCYAGDRRPVASELAAHCSIADLRVIAPDGR